MTDKKLSAICKAFRDGLLDGAPSRLMCAIVSLPLQGFLSSIGVQTEYVIVDFLWGNHAFLRLADGRVLDATADQFETLRLPPIYIGPPLSIHRKEEPIRVQRKRTKGWKAPEGAVYVGRPTVFGNKWAIGVHSNLIGRRVETREEAVRCFREVGPGTEPQLAAYIRETLRGKDLMCWCPLDQPCHADVLLEIAND